MSAENFDGLDRATQEAIGMHLELMYHTAKSIHDMTGQLIAGGVTDENEATFWAIQELARGQARELEALAVRLQGNELGYYAEHFKDAALV